MNTPTRCAYYFDSRMLSSGKIAILTIFVGLSFSKSFHDDISLTESTKQNTFSLSTTTKDNYSVASNTAIQKNNNDFSNTTSLNNTLRGNLTLEIAPRSGFVTALTVAGTLMSIAQGSPRI